MFNFFKKKREQEQINKEYPDEKSISIIFFNSEDGPSMDFDSDLTASQMEEFLYYCSNGVLVTLIINWLKIQHPETFKEVGKNVEKKLSVLKDHQILEEEPQAKNNKLAVPVIIRGHHGK